MTADVITRQFDFRSAAERVLAKQGMPGVDGIPAWRLRKDLAGCTAAVSARLVSEYRALPLRLAEIAKKNGTARLLLVPTVVDRVAQTAAANWLVQRWNPNFDDNSFAYRPGLGVADALKRVAEIRERGLRWILDADIQNFFDSIDHRLLLAHVEKALPPGMGLLLEWLRGWVGAAVWDGESICRLTRGVPQGSPLSPLLANFFLDQFDREIRARRIAFVRYADDFVVLAKTPFDLASAADTVRDALTKLKLQLSESKTRKTSFDAGFRFLGAEVQGDRILLPFGQKKPKSEVLYVAPVMPPALMRAYTSGQWDTSQEFVWRPHTATRVPKSDPLPPTNAALETLRRRPL